ncbi:MAG TPA: OmpA family protein [Pyrinomonadaceae bacterium]
MTKITFPFLFLCALCVAPVAAQDGGEKPRPYTIESNELKLAAPVLFADGGDKLLPESERPLAVVKDFLNEKTYITVLRIEGHTDTGGDAATNQQLSERRAFAVARRLVEKGVDCGRLLPVGFGGTKTVAPDDTPENRRKNRRLAFVFASLRGRLIGGMPADGGGKIAGDPCLK